MLGGDAAGVVAGVGSGVSGFSIGDRVIADFALNGRGAHAEYGVVPATAVAKLPANLSFEQGATLPKAGLTGRQSVDALGVGAGARVLISGGLGAVGRAAIQYLQEIGAKPVAGVRSDRIDEARHLAGEALDITAPPADATFDYAISAAAPVALNLIRHVRDGGQVASIVPVPEGVNTGNRVRIHELYHRADACTLAAVALKKANVSPLFARSSLQSAAAPVTHLPAKLAKQMCHFAFVRSKYVTLWMRRRRAVRNVLIHEGFFRTVRRTTRDGAPTRRAADRGLQREAAKAGSLVFPLELCAVDSP